MPTSNAGEQLPGKALYLTTRKGHELVALEKVKNALTKQIRHNAYMISEIEAIS